MVVRWFDSTYRHKLKQIITLKRGVHLVKNCKNDMEERIFTLKEILAMCKEEHIGFFTYFKIGEGELFLRKMDFKGDITFKRVPFFRTRGGDPRCAFEVGRQMGDTSCLLIAIEGENTSFVDEKMKFVIR